jgi:hypothetical protein
MVSAATGGPSKQEVYVPAFVRTILVSPNQHIKAYKGTNPVDANTLFASDATAMAGNAWHVQSQHWTSDAVFMTRRFVWGTSPGSGGGTLRVTYSR